MATTTTTTTTTTRTATSVPMRNPKDSMKSTWRKQPDKEGWGHSHHALENLGMRANIIGKSTPVHSKSEKVPHIPDWQGHVWVWLHAIPLMVIHEVYTSVFGHNIHPFGAFLLCFLFYQICGIHHIQRFCQLGHIYGHLDGDQHKRDDVPDVGVDKVFKGLLFTSILRSAMTAVLTYNTKETPLQMNLLVVLVEIGMYEVILDFWFYWYHRMMHQSATLWKFHRTHHLTKHPNTLLSLYADQVQEFFDIIGIPVLTWYTLRLMGFPMGYYEWWICQSHQIFTELAGHSGLRANLTPPSTFTPLLRWLDMELCTEDHDLHHRNGWKKSHNYGKQTRVWDRLFGTCAGRIEMDESNIDYENTASLFIDGLSW